VTKRKELPAPIALTLPLPGDFCCVPISGGAGLGIEIGQWLDGDRFQPYDHAEIYVGQPGSDAPHGYTVSAYPGGNGRRPLPCPPQDLPGSLWSSRLIRLTMAQRTGICAWAGEHRDAEYSFADYGALVLHMLHVPAPGLKEFISSTSHLICSQFVDTAYLSAGVHLFSDGRWPGYVKPGDLAKLLLSLAPKPGRDAEGPDP
jgi:hypothetical protein